MEKIKLEYLWLDGYRLANLRGKTKIASGDPANFTLKTVQWGFEKFNATSGGSSSDCLLKPVSIYPDSTRKNAFLVMCECSCQMVHHTLLMPAQLFPMIKAYG